MPSSPDILTDHELAGDLATKAGTLLLTLREELAGASADFRRDEGDRQAAEIIVRCLAASRPQDAVLVEDAVDDEARLDCDRVWIIDPLDGTREFGEPGRDDWAVHVALWSDGRLAAGAVAMPATGQLFLADPPVTLAARRPGPLRIAASRSRPQLAAQEVARVLGADMTPMGSAGVKTMAVITGVVDAYIHDGGQYEWDSAAPAAVAIAAGLHVSRVDGSALVYNQPGAWLPDLVVCRTELAREILSILAGLEEGIPS